MPDDVMEEALPLERVASEVFDRIIICAREGGYHEADQWVRVLKLLNIV